MAFLGFKGTLTVWLEADMLYAPWNGRARTNVFDTWYDQSGLGTNFPVTGADEAVNYNQLNGRPGITYDGAAAYDRSAANVSSMVSLTQGTMFVVFKCTSTPSNVATVKNNTGLLASGTLGSAGTGKSVGLYLKNVGGTTPTLYAYGNDGADNQDSIPFTMSQWGIAIWKLKSGLLQVGYNDESNLSAGVACGSLAATGNPMNIGVGTGATDRYFGGQLAAVLIFSDGLSQVNMATVMNYLRAKYFSPNYTVISPLTRADSLEQARAVVSDHVWKKRRAIVTFTPSPMLLSRMPSAGLELAQDVRIMYPYGPDPNGAAAGASSPPTGWGPAPWQRRSMRVRALLIDGDRKTIQPTLRDNRMILRSYASTEVAARSLNLQRQGVLTIGKAPARAFYRSSYAWVPDVVSGYVVRIDPNQEKLSSQGLLLEGAAKNEITRSSFVSGTTGLTPAGTGVNGSAIAVDAAPTYVLFDSAVTGNSLKFTAGSPHTADLLEAFPAFTTPGTGVNLYVSVDHYDDSGQVLNWVLQRSSDSHYWDDTNKNWTSAAIVYNAFPLSSATAIARGQSNAIAAPASGTLTLKLGFQSGGTAGRIAHVYHVQGEDWGLASPTSALCATSRIVCDGSAVTRAADALRAYDANGVMPGEVGTLLMRFIPLGASGTDGLGVGPLLLWMKKVGANPSCMRLGLSATTLTLEQVDSAGTTVDVTATVAPAAGTVCKIAARWTGSNGELSLAARTADVFFNGVKGTAGVLTAAVTPTNFDGTGVFFGEDLAAFTNNSLAPNGYVSSIEFIPEALTDLEIANW